MNLVKQSEANRKDVRSLVAILKRIQPEIFTVDPAGLTVPTPSTQEHPIIDQKFGETEMSSDKEGRVGIRGVHISMGKFQSGFLKKHISFPDCICFPGYKKYRSLAF